MKTNKKTKFTLEKFEVAKLKNMRSINGGGDETPTKDPIETTKIKGTSSNDCF